MTTDEQPEAKERPQERRAAARYPATEAPALLGWWQGPEYRSTPARLVDVSQGGARVRVEDLPPADRPLWICLFGPPPSPWVEATIVWCTVTTQGTKDAHLAFRDSCPYDVFKAAVADYRHHHRTEAVSPEFDGRYWR